MLRQSSSIFLLGISLMAFGALTVAQSNQASAATAAKPAAPAATSSAAAPVSADPGSTFATYGDWIVRCQRVGEGDKAQRLCEVAQTLQVKGQKGPIAQVAFGKVAAADPMKLTVVLPSNITLPSSAKLGMSDKDPQPLDLAWRRCMASTCIAEAVPTSDVMKAFRGASEPGRLSFKDAAGRDIALPLSFRGLPQALDALAKS